MKSFHQMCPLLYPKLFFRFTDYLTIMTWFFSIEHLPSSCRCSFFVWKCDHSLFRFIDYLTIMTWFFCIKHLLSSCRCRFCVWKCDHSLFRLTDYLTIMTIFSIECLLSSCTVDAVFVFESVTIVCLGWQIILLSWHDFLVYSASYLHVDAVLCLKVWPYRSVTI